MKKEAEHQLYMDMADRVAQESYCVRAKVGSIVVTNEDSLHFGFNGTVSGAENVCELEDGTTDPFVLHAESNAILKAAKHGSKLAGATIYVTHAPCKDCAKLIKQAGITTVIYKQFYKNSDGIDFLKRSGVFVYEL